MELFFLTDTWVALRSPYTEGNPSKKFLVLKLLYPLTWDGAINNLSLSIYTFHAIPWGKHFCTLPLQPDQHGVAVNSLVFLCKSAHLMQLLATYIFLVLESYPHVGGGIDIFLCKFAFMQFLAIKTFWYLTPTLLHPYWVGLERSFL